MTPPRSNFDRAERAYERGLHESFCQIQEAESEDLDPGDYFGYDSYADYLEDCGEKSPAED